MAIICLGVGTATLGTCKRNKAGEIVEQTPAKWEADQQGGSVCLWQADPETMEPAAPAELFGDWQAAEYLGRALELLQPQRGINVPNLQQMIRRALADGFDLCDYCQDCNCRVCIMNEWKGDTDDE